MICIRRNSLASYCLALLLAVPSYIHAQVNTLQVRPADREVITQQPRQVVGVAFTVYNAIGRRVRVEPRLVLPEGWRQVTPELPFDLGDAETTVRLVSFMIPETARAGEYPVTYEVQNRLQPTLRGAYTMQVNILPEQKLQVASLEASGFAIAGESYPAVFLVRNTGNAPITAAFKIRSVYGSEPQPRAGTVQLEPGETKNIEFVVMTPQARRRTDELLTLTVEVPGTTIRDSASSATQVVPRISAGQAYHTMATELDLSLVSREVHNHKSSGWQVGIAGVGTLDEENTRNLAIHLRGPDVREHGSFGYTDDYSLRYWDRTTNAKLGDDIYGLSLLTEPGRYGRGIGLGYEGDSLGVSAYQAKDRFSSTGREQIGLNAHYQPTAATRLDFNSLDKRGGIFPGTLHSLSSRTRWTDSVNTVLEIGASEGEGERGQAARGEFYAGSRALRYYLYGWHSDPEYRGYLRDEEYLTTGFDLPRGRWGLHGYYRTQERNLDADPSRPAPQEQQMNFGIDRTLATRTRATLDYNVRRYADNFTLHPVDIENRSTRVSLNQSFQRFSLVYAFEGGKTRNYLTGTSFDTALHVLSAYLQASQSQSYGLYAMRDDNAFSKEPEGIHTTFGLSARYDLDWLTLSLDAQRNYEVYDDDFLQYRQDTGSHYDKGTTRRSSYNLAALHKLRNGDRISLLARHLSGRLSQTDVLLTYAMPFDLPLFRRANVSTVRGRIYDAESGAGMRNVVLNLDGLTAVTDARGEFEFPAVTAGSYQLSMDRSNIDVGKVPGSRLPLNVTVDANAARQVDVALVRSVIVSVSVNLLGDGAATRGVRNMLITLQKGDQVYRRLTDADGHVQLTGLPPGEWTASIAAEAIPEGYAASTREVVLDAPPGASVNVEFALTPIRRELKMLPPLQVN